MQMDTNKIIVGVVLLGASLFLGRLFFRECTHKEKIVAGALIGAANGAFIGGAVPMPGSALVGAATGAAVGAYIGDNYDRPHRHAHENEQ